MTSLKPLTLPGGGLHLGLHDLAAGLTLPEALPPSVEFISVLWILSTKYA